MSARESAFEETFKKDIKRREHLENVLKLKNRGIRSAQKSIRDKMEESENRLKSRNEEISRDRRDFVEKVQSKHKKIDQQYKDH